MYTDRDYMSGILRFSLFEGHSIRRSLYLKVTLSEGHSIWRSLYSQQRQQIFLLPKTSPPALGLTQLVPAALPRD